MWRSFRPWEVPPADSESQALGVESSEPLPFPAHRPDVESSDAGVESGDGDERIVNGFGKLSRGKERGS
jgi:hypothetical protein